MPKLLAALLVGLLFILAAATPASAHSDKPGEGWFEFKCTVAVQSARIDPLVFPGDVGTSHWHQEVGNLGWNENSTNASLRANPATTCADDNELKQGVPPAQRKYGNAIWYPLFSDNGAPLTATRVTSGYSVGNVRDFAAIQPFQDDMNFIAGSAAGGPSEINGQRVYMAECPGGLKRNPDGTFVNRGSAKVAPLCATKQLRVTIFAPDCSDGRATAANFKDHMVYSKQAAAGNPFRVCPADHPILIPAHRIMIELPTFGGPALTVATGSGDTATLFGTLDRAHFDYMSAVARDADGSNTRTARTFDCLNQNEYCGGTAKPVPGEGGGI